jgi:hypothetical protein
MKFISWQLWGRACVLALLAALASVPGAFANVVDPGGGGDWYVSDYTFSRSDCLWSSRTDPVNVVFDRWGTVGRAETAVRWAMDWWYGGGTTQSVFTSSGCSSQDVSVASAQPWEDRSHIRLFAVPYSATYGWTTAGDAHQEKVCDFNHVIYPDWWYWGDTGTYESGFNHARNAMVRTMAGQFGAVYEGAQYWGNTETQWNDCSLWYPYGYASSDGYVVFIRIPQ